MSAIVKPKVAAIVGPTASGKSEVAIELCRVLNGEAVSMDAMQVYQGMRVGTARLEPGEWRGIPHHALAYVPPDSPYSVAEYARDALIILEDILSRGKLPVLVGGTGLYLSAVRRPMRFAGTPSDHIFREELERLDNESLRLKLTRADPVTAARLPVGDRRRMIRALEIARAAGAPMSALRDDTEDRFDMLVMGIDVPRAALLERIRARTQSMLDAGLVDEVGFLLRCGLSAGAQSMQAIGYKETAQAIYEQWPREKLLEAIEVRTRQYAKRQMTWFRRVEGIRWFDGEAAADEMIESVRVW
ncbi:MAG: tRNA (adenosine(37)-N6)-dimethylallyltransferase MiaA, partial [Oscillospiraceae bacterium]|nr:tRNA (adenosine(37)-N6)-dimethylallyltransferase MiaA [Oscillospiraceae bacterium]